MKYLVFDISNLLYRAFYAYKQEDVETIAGMAHQVSMSTVNKYYKRFKPDKIVMCFDRPNWRKEYTMSDECLSGREYKGNRRKDMTEADLNKYKQFLTHLHSFEDIIRDHTSIQALAGEGLEADDLVAGFVDYYTLVEQDHDIVIISGDKDLMQLLRYDSVQLIDPDTGKNRLLDEWDSDADLFLFEKCLRGDRGDNVMSAYPRIRKTRIIKAYNDPLEHENIMHHVWTAPGMDGKTFTVKDLYKENQLLMDLTKQPDDIKRAMFKVVINGRDNPGKFSYFHFMKFLGKNNLNKLAENANRFAHMLSC